MSGQGWSGTFTVEGEPTGPDVQLPHGEYAVAMPGYFQVMRIALLVGRDFTPADRIEAPRVVIVDERLAQRHWPNQTAIGKRINAGGQQGDWATVVGVVRHVYNSGPHSEGEPQLYLPYLQSPQAPIFIVTRTDSDTLSMVAGMRASVREMDAGLPVSKIDRMGDLVSKAVAAPRFNTVMLGVFALVALAIACTGLYGAMSYVVARRTHEIGIRIALGGSPGEVRRMVLRESLLIAVTGLFIGSLASLTLSRLLSGLLYGVEPTDPATYAGTTAILLFVSIMASYGPARRATRVDPVVALRN
jgi:predicted permease